MHQVNAALAEVLDTGTMPPAMGDVLSRYGARFGLEEVLLVRARPLATVLKERSGLTDEEIAEGGLGFMGLNRGEQIVDEFLVQTRRYHPRLRRFLQ